MWGEAIWQRKVNQLRDLMSGISKSVKKLKTMGRVII